MLHHHPKCNVYHDKKLNTKKIIHNTHHTIQYIEMTSYVQ